MNNAQWQRAMNVICSCLKSYFTDMNGIQRKATKDEINRYLKDKWGIE